ncbi:MAG: VCBS repeat-containing protein [Gammaproteobacteria bacterium]|nr:VCBS repeat-containing protein [Gammaproteobacteria bacterium]
MHAVSKQGGLAGTNAWPLTVALGLTLALAGCGSGKEPQSAAPAAALTGKELIDKHCTRCHLAPEPGDLSKEYWSFALHYMGNYVGMKGDEFPDMRTEEFPPELEPVKDYTKRYFLYDSHGYFRDLYPFRLFIPPQPEMTPEEFRRMREYVVAGARTWRELEQQYPKAPVTKTFRAQFPKLDLEPDALILSTQVDPKRRRLYVGRTVIDDWVGGGGRREGFDKWDEVLAFDIRSGQRIGSTRVGSDPIDMALTEHGLRLVTHGRFPLTEVGIANIADWEIEGKQVRTRMLVNGKQRLVQHHNVDMNGDGLVDIVANAFGDGVAQDAQSFLGIYYRTPDFERLWREAPAEIPPGVLPGALRENLLAVDSGTIGNAIADFNGDGRPDIAVVVAQGHQLLLVYTNNGDETFTRHLIDQHTPSWGGNSLRAADFDGDGDMDLVVLNGDNVAGNHVGKVVPAPRPQHGIRVYRNDGDLKFTEAFYHRMHGAIRSVVEDFDGDGDADIAAIALFPQWSYEEPETFVYLENQGGLKFEAQSVSREFFGVWCSIEAADVNGDGRTDLVLGLGNFPELVPPDWITAHPAMKDRGGKAGSILFLLNQT